MGLFSFGLIWTVVIALFTVGMITSGISSQSLFPLLMMIPFWAVGIGMLLASYNMGTRTAIIDVIGDTLLITRKNLFGTRQQEWRVHDLQTVRVGPSGMEVNDREVMQLQVVPEGDNKVGLFAGRSVEELRWIAQVINRALGM